jgi:hypothetical protein
MGQLQYVTDSSQERLRIANEIVCCPRTDARDSGFGSGTGLGTSGKEIRPLRQRRTHLT